MPARWLSHIFIATAVTDGMGNAYLKRGIYFTQWPRNIAPIGHNATARQSREGNDDIHRYSMRRYTISGRKSHSRLHVIFGGVDDS